MPPTWTPSVTFVHPPVLTRSQGRLCQLIQREFIESLIQEFGPNYMVGITFSLPKSGYLRIRPLWRILQFPCLIFQFLVPLTDDDWDYVVRWGRTTLPHGRFQKHNEIISVTTFSRTQGTEARIN